MQKLTLGLLALPIYAILMVSPASAQNAISAKSGMVHYIEGRVFIGNDLVESKFGAFPDIKENVQLRTEEGRAEVLLTPGVFLRVGENSAIRMITNRLIDTRLEFLSGSAVVEADDLLKDNSVTVVFGDATVKLKKHGLYRFDAEPAQLRVYDGEAEVEKGGESLLVKEGRLVAMAGELVAEKFDIKIGDSLNRWSKRRSEYLALANVSAAKSLRDSGRSWGASSWFWNPYYGMFTFIPMRGAYYSPYGYRFWSPFEVYRVYAPRVYVRSFADSPGWNRGLGYNTSVATSSGHSGTMVSAPAAAHGGGGATAASSGASAPVSRSSGHAGGGRGR